MECKTKWALKRMNEWTRLISGWIKQIYCNCFSPLILAVQRCLCLKSCLVKDITCAITWYIQIKDPKLKKSAFKVEFSGWVSKWKMAWKARNRTICHNAKQQKTTKKKKWQLSKCSERKFSAVQCHGYHVCTWHLWTLIFFEFSPQTGVYVGLTVYWKIKQSEDAPCYHLVHQFRAKNQVIINGFKKSKFWLEILRWKHEMA